MHKKSVTISEITFPSIEAAAAHFGQSYRNVARRIQSGWSAEESLGLTPHKLKRPGKGIPITTSSGHFDSILDAGEHFGISHATIRKRLEMGWTPNQAVGLESHTKKPRQTKEVFCAGKAYSNSWSLAEAYEKKQKLVAKRLLLGWTPEQAVEIEDPPPRFRNRNNGATNKHWKNVEVVSGIEYPATDLGEYKLYIIKNRLDGKEYVGITINPLWQRFNGHKRSVTRQGLRTRLT